MNIQPLPSLIRSTRLAATLVALAVCSSVHVFSQTVDTEASTLNELVVHIEGLSNDTIYLANYYGAKLFYNDTAVTDVNGTVTFAGKPFDEGGKYAVVLPGPNSSNS